MYAYMCSMCQYGCLCCTGNELKAKDPKKQLEYLDTNGWTTQQIRTALTNKECDAWVETTSYVNIAFRDKNFMGDEKDSDYCKFGTAGEPFQNAGGGWVFSLKGETCPQFLLGAFSEMLSEFSRRRPHPRIARSIS